MLCNVLQSQYSGFLLRLYYAELQLIRLLPSQEIYTYIEGVFILGEIFWACVT